MLSEEKNVIKRWKFVCFWATGHKRGEVNAVQRACAKFAEFLNERSVLPSECIIISTENVEKGPFININALLYTDAPVPTSFHCNIKDARG